MPNVKPDTLTGFVQDIFVAAGVRDDIATRVAESLVLSNLQGHDSHGIVRVNLYLDQLRQGSLHPTADPVAVEESPSVVIMDAQRSFGQWSAYVLMRNVMAKAQAQGVASGGLVNSGHVGRLGEWVTMAADAGYIGLAFCNGGGRPGIVAPFGGSERVLGTNPPGCGYSPGRPVTYRHRFCHQHGGGGQGQDCLQQEHGIAAQQHSGQGWPSICASCGSL